MKLGLVACSKSKALVPMPARLLYTSPLFYKSMELATRECDHVVILSAKHGLVEPDQLLHPYNVTLKTMSKVERQEWSVRVREQMLSHYAGWQYVYYAGSVYCDNLPKGQMPLAGLKLGERLSRLTKASAATAKLF